MVKNFNQSRALYGFLCFLVTQILETTVNVFKYSEQSGNGTIQ